MRQLEASQRAFGALRADGRVVTWGDAVFGGWILASLAGGGFDSMISFIVPIELKDLGTSKHPVGPIILSRFFFFSDAFGGDLW